MQKKPRIQPTHPITNRHKHEAKLRRLNALQWLAQEFPEAFDNRIRIRPLKIGILQDVLAYAEKFTAAGFSKSKIRAAIVLFARRVDYLVSLRAHEARIDLLGNPCGAVTEAEAIKAKNKIKKRIEKAIKHIHQSTAVKQPSLSIARQRTSTSITIKSRPRAFDSKIVKKLEEELSLAEPH